MRTSWLVALLSLLSLPVACARAQGDARREPAAGEGPLVIELFTSQGCSSCPPAEALLDRLASSDHSLAPLAFHVDYWDDLGWPDPFALPAWTARQQAYARALGDRSVYTPELVVGGAAGLVGSNASAVAVALRDAARPTRLAATATWTTGQLVVTATAPTDADVLVAVWEDGTHTKISRGENAGTSVGGDRVVRRLERVASAGKRGTLTLHLDPSWHAVGAVAFAQRADHKIVASAVLPR